MAHPLPYGCDLRVPCSGALVPHLRDVKEYVLIRFDVRSAALCGPNGLNGSLRILEGAPRHRVH